MTDDAVPQIQPEWVTGPVTDPTNPHIYLPGDPTEAEQLLADVLDRESANVHLAKVAFRLHSLLGAMRHVANWMARWDGREKLVRRIGGAIAGIAVANIVVVITSWLHAHDARIVAETEARAAAQAEIVYRRTVQDQIDRMERELSDLRRDIRRIGGATPDPHAGVVAVGAP